MTSEARAGARLPDGVEIARRLLVAVAALAILGTVLGLLLVQRVGTTYRDGLEVARDTALVAASSTGSIEQLATDVSQLASSAAKSLEQATSVVGSASTSATDIGTALGSNVAEALDGTAGVANRMAAFIETIERFIPGNTKSLAEDLRALADGLEPLPAQLRSLGNQLTQTSTDLLSASVNLQEVARQLELISESIDEAKQQIVGVDALANDIAARAERALDRSSVDLWLFRILVVVLGLGTLTAGVAAYRAVGALARRQLSLQAAVDQT